ncbi:MAG: acyl-CoA synthetase [Deltaproteobacteria bacterium]|nr:acyl-CoA synthetase [Deltaproteobacteria bacterium]
MEFNLAQLHEAIAEAIPDRECIIFRDRRLSWADVTERTRRLANHLIAAGLEVRAERAELQGWESGQPHVALYMHNCNEYLEGMLGAYKARSVPFNVNYRYVEEELVYLLNDAGAEAIVYHSEFAPTLAKILPQLPKLRTLVQVEDGSGEALLPGAVEYEAALAAASPERPKLEWSPDDLYILYTGGTTGMPKGVLWRQNDIFIAALGGRARDGSAVKSVDEILERARTPLAKSLPAPPFMHGAAHWAAFTNFHGGNAIVIQEHTSHLDGDDVWSTVVREEVTAMLIVGDAFGRPLLDQLDKKTYDLSKFGVLITGGAALSASLKKEFLERIPHLVIVDAIGSSESGGQGQNISTKDTGATTGSFQPGPDTCVLSEDLTHVLEPGSEEIGWFAKAGHVPLGYLGDREKTERTFPTTNGVRYSVPGDRSRHLESGIIEVYGRDSQTINSGGEKIFAEEVEHALKQQAPVWDAVVVGRPSERWGQEVVALVRLRDGADATREQLIEECSKHIARYKLPKDILFRDEIVRSPSGKADYRWAKEQLG